MMTLIEKILASHTDRKTVKPGDIIDVKIDSRVARDFGGANVVKHLLDHDLQIDNPQLTYFTFDCNPGGSDQKYAANQHFCRIYARENDIRIYDINSGVGTHIAIDQGLAYPGSTFVSTDSHANIMGAIGCFGQGMGDQDVAAAFAKGSVWFKVPETIKIHFTGKLSPLVSAKDFALNLLSVFGANKLLGYSVELDGECLEHLNLDQRITISSMATEMGAIILFFTPNEKIIEELQQKTGKKYPVIKSDPDAVFARIIELDASTFRPMVSRPGHPEDTIEVDAVKNSKIDSAFIGSCTNGRMTDLRTAANILKGRKIAPGVVLKIVPATDEIWNQALSEGLISIFKEAGAMVSNPGCAGCAAGQVGQNGPGEVTVSTGNRNFEDKQGKGFVYLASPETVAASALAGYITTADDIPDIPAVFEKTGKIKTSKENRSDKKDKPVSVEGRIWIISKDNVDTDMIYHNRHIAITDIKEMGQYALGNLKGYEDFAKKAQAGDIIIAAKNFGAGSSRQQAVDCFLSLGISCILAESFGAIYERNAINAALPILTYEPGIIDTLGLTDGDTVSVDFISGVIINRKNDRQAKINPFYPVQLEIYKNGGLL